jgi:hypothetical protein
MFLNKQILLLIIILPALVTLQSQYYPITLFDLEEIDQASNNCQLSSGLDNRLLCDRIPLYCSKLCQKLKFIYFSQRVESIVPFAFSNYILNSKTLTITFDKSLSLIDSDAFSGINFKSLIINIIGQSAQNDTNSQLKVNISLLFR